MAKNLDEVVNKANLDFDDETLKAIAEVYKDEGNEEYRKKEFSNVIHFYTEGIKVNCRDEEMNAKLYSNRATAHFYQGNYHEFLNDARVAVELQPTYIKAIARGARACVELRLFAEAIAWCDKALAIVKNHKPLLELRSRSIDALDTLNEKSQEKGKIEPMRRNFKEQQSDNRPKITELLINLYERRLQIAKEMGDRYIEGSAYHSLANLYYGRGDFKKAICCYEQYLKRAEEVEDRSGEVYFNLGYAYSILGDYKKAIEYYERRLNFATDSSTEGSLYGCLGHAYRKLGNCRKAIFYHERCLKIAKDVGDRSFEASVQGNLGCAYHRLGDFQKSIFYHKRNLQIAKEMGDRCQEGEAYINLGNAYCSLGELKKAIEYHERCRTIAKEKGNKPLEGRTYYSLGISYYNLGDLRKAMDYHKQHLNIAKAVEDRYEEGCAYGSLGNVYHSLGDFQKAIDYHERCLQIARDVQDRYLEGKAYGHLGTTFRRLGNFQKAIEYHTHRLKIAEEVEDRPGEGCAYGNLGNTYYTLGNFKKAIDCYERRLKLAKEIRDRPGEGHAYCHLGNAYNALGDIATAIDYHKLQLKISKEVGESVLEGKAYLQLGGCYFSIGDVKKGRDYVELALRIAKQVEDMVAVGDAYKILGSINESLGSLHEALECFQNSVNAFNEVRIRLQSKDEWKISLRDMHQHAYTALLRVLLKLNRSVEALCAAEKGRAQALNDLMQSYFGILTAETMASAEEETIQRTISSIPFNTIFLAFDQGVINLWVIQNGKDVCRRVKEVADLNTSTRDDVIGSLQELVESTFAGIGVRDGVNCEDRSLGELRKPYFSKESFHQTQSHSLQSLQHQLRRLYDVIMDPVADLIHGDEIIIVPEGPLWLVPYAALMDPNSSYLSDSFRIRVIPSLASLKLILDCPADYHSTSGALVVGDPWVQEVINDRGQKLDQLPYARREVEMIGRILNTAPLTGKEATKNEVLKRLSTVALVHIAAHGRMETGEIALCPNPSRASRAPKDEDFLLTISDVMNVKLTARLVVLSCCHSGRGEIKAEGVVGIARAFLGVGARSVLVSLWAIDDEATLEFMKVFYQHLVQGKNASEALNQAMKCMRESENFGEVKYWAPFVLIGDDVTLEFAGSD